LSHATISGHHCTFSRDAENQVVVEDMGSANGTWIDGRDIRGAGPVTLSPGQQIHFGLLKTWYTS
jgi:pSer/pThr/pTyr-binding forkhead associated (FHA) protein